VAALDQVLPADRARSRSDVLPYSHVRPWLALLALWITFAIPLTLCALVPELSHARLDLELPLLWTLACLAPRLRPVLAGCLGLLVAYRLDQWLCLLLMREQPLLYDQWFMARHLGVLLSDLLSVGTLLGSLAFGLLAWALVRLVRSLWRHAEAPPHARSVLIMFWLAMLPLSLCTARVGWLSADLARNLVESRAVYQRVSARAASWPRAPLMAHVPRDKPDVLLFLVESYGRLLFAEPSTRDEHATLLHTLQRELAQAGVHAVSAFATATVSGGRSWIAEGTVLSGMPIHYEAEFQHLIGQQPPSLVSWLAQAGYHSTLLLPADRDRPGARVVNRWGFDEVIAHAQLDYRGRPIGWGIVPDQFSLAYAERNLLSRAGPLFFDFHMVSSHAPWAEVPVLDAQVDEVAAEHRLPAATGTPFEKVLAGLGYYLRADARDPWMGALDSALRRGYQATVSYDLRLIARYLARRERDALVIVMGDHQPPVLSRADLSFEVPVHVLSKDARRLAKLPGFTAGLWLDPAVPPSLHQAELWPALVDALR
jgi:hypothetical protein